MARVLNTRFARGTGKAWRAIACAVLALPVMLLAPSVSAQTRLVPVPGVVSFEQRFMSGDNIRRVLYLRPAADPVGMAPVMVLLHFGGGNPEAMANLTRIGQWVRDSGVWAILPEASGRAWNHDPRRDRNGTEDDVGLISRVIDNAVGSMPVDPGRIYMTGFSSGGFMAQRYACERPERLAAMSYVSATLLDSLAARCRLNAALPTLGIHGTADTRVDYGDRVGLSSAPDTARFFASRNGCLGAPQRTRLPDLTDDGTTVDLDSWSSCSTTYPVLFYTINRGGHTWPGNDLQVGLRGRVSRDIDATRVSWDFMSRYSR